MKDLIFIQHSPGAPGLRILGVGPNLMPSNGMEQLKTLLNKNTSWANHRKKNDIKKMLSGSEIIVSVWENKKLIGFGRATSDKVYRAILWDIVVDKKYQRLGIGGKIIKAILSNRLISKVEKIYIMTTKCEKFYSKMGFKSEKFQKLMILR